VNRQPGQLVQLADLWWQPGELISVEGEPLERSAAANGPREGRQGVEVQAEVLYLGTHHKTTTDGQQTHRSGQQPFLWLLYSHILFQIIPYTRKEIDSSKRSKCHDLVMLPRCSTTADWNNTCFKWPISSGINAMLLECRSSLLSDVILLMQAGMLGSLFSDMSLHNKQAATVSSIEISL
jgi:hypothetical protein